MNGVSVISTSTTLACHTFTAVKTTATRAPKLRVTTHTKVITEIAAIAVT